MTSTETSQPSPEPDPTATGPVTAQTTEQDDGATGAVAPAPEDGAPSPVVPAELPGPEEAEDTPDETATSLAMMLDLPLDVTVELGRTRMQLGEALALQSGSIVELDRLPGEPLDMHVNDRLVARGEVVVVNDVLALRITEIIGQETASNA